MADQRVVEPSVLYRLRLESHGETTTFLVRRGETTIGTSSDNDLVLSARTLSRRHAVLRFDGSVLTLEDVGSKNGTFVNGAPVMWARLTAGDRINLGEVVATVETIAADDEAIAIPLAEGEGTAGPQRVSPATTETSARRKSDEPRRWVDLLDELGDDLLGPTDPDLTAILSKLADGLQAAGACVLRRDGTGDLSVLSMSRTTAPMPSFESLRPLSAAIANAGRTANVLAAFVVDGDAPMALAAAAGPTCEPRALAVWGEFPHRAASRPLLRHVLRLVLHSQPEHISLPTSHPLKPAVPLCFPAGHVVGVSDAMRDLYRQMEALRQGDLPVLITGETGVGKEHVARSLHLSSRRRAGPFKVVHCAAIPAELLEAELFGIEKGVATGVEARAGTFELASGGVVFLDEIGDMPLALQAKMLRVLQSGEIQTVGAGSAKAVDVRVIAATNADLPRLVEQGRFRADLYYRIAGFVLHVPPLRERREDIPALVEHFLRTAAAEVGKPVRGISVKALAALVAAPWPGNVRQLELEVRRLVYICPAGEAIDSTMLPAELLAPAPLLDRDLSQAGASLELEERVADLERRLIMLALARTRGNKAKAARLLGISRNGLLLKMERLGID